jgi:hypothetical protein
MPGNASLYVESVSSVLSNWELDLVEKLYLIAAAVTIETVFCSCLNNLNSYWVTDYSSCLDHIKYFSESYAFI